MHEHHEHPAGSDRPGHRFSPDRRHALRSEERRQWLPPEPILRAAGIRNGEVVLDVGAGTGFWTAPLSRLVGPEGRILAVDVEPIMLDELRATIATERLTNVQIAQSEDAAIPLRSDVADFAMLGFVLHEPASPPRFLTEVRRILKPDGRILVVDWEKRTTEKGPPLEARIARDDAHALLREAGFRIVDLDSPTDEVYILLGETVAR